MKLFRPQDADTRSAVQRRFRFTHALLEALPAHDVDSPSREMEYSDTEITGFRLLVGKTGRKTFYQRYVLEGRKGVARIGPFPSVSLKDARTRAHEVRSMVARGEDPKAEREARAAVPTVADFCKDYLHYARQHGKKSVRDDEIRLEKEVIPRFGKLKMTDITTRDVQAMHAQLRTKLAPATCNRYLSIVQRLFSVAIDWGIVEKNPARAVKKYQENNARERYLAKDELARFLEALDTLENRSIANGLKFLLMTGVRKNEAFRLRWEHVDREAGTVFLADTKSGKSRTVILNVLAREVVEVMWSARADDAPWVFPGKRKGRPVVSPQKPFEEACRIAGIERLRIHDLRHSFASLAINSGASLYDVQKLLGHASSQMTQRYAHLEDTSVRKATEQVAHQIGLTGTDG